MTEAKHYATVENVATTLGKEESNLSDINKKQIDDWIGKAERKIRKRLGNLDLLDKDDLRDVISEVVARRSRNPEGKKYESIDDYRYGYDEDVAKGTIFITDEEWDQLTPDVIDRDVGSVSLAGSPGYGPTAYGASDHPVKGWWQ